MPLKWICLIFNLFICTVALLKNDTTKALIELIEFDYEDTCSNTTEAEWEFVNAPSNETLLKWEEKLISYADFKSTQKNELPTISSIITDPLIQYKYNVTEKVGDALLQSEDFKTLIHFTGTAELLRLTKSCTEILNNCTKKDVEHTLSHGQDIENKKSIWTAWHQELTPLFKNFSNVLLLVDKAAKANGAKDITEYWELLSGYNNGYNESKYEWSKISNLHKKILKFIISHLSNKYKIAINDTVPAYLLGSIQGNDWTTISVDATPYPDLMNDIKKNLWKQKLMGKSLYKTASAMSIKILNQVPQADFWSKSHFNQQCPSKLFNFCKEGTMRVSTCFEPTLSNFLSTHKNVGKIIFNQLSVETIPVLNIANRYSALEEGVSELFGILSASSAWLKHNHIMSNSTDNFTYDEQLIVSLMITALNTLPRLAYYISADMWRINAIKLNILNPEDLISTWWKYRQEYEGITSNGIEVPTFLNDEYITSNRPYLSKLTGIILAFQFYEYLMDSTEVRHDSIMPTQIKGSFIKMIQSGAADNWMRIINKFLDIDQISSNSLLSFFAPLEDFIDELEDNFQSDIADRELELEKIEKEVIEEINASSIAVTPTNATITSTSIRSIVTERKMINATSLNKQNSERSDVNTIGTSNKGLESKSSVNVPEEKLKNRNMLNSKTSTEVPFDKSILDSVDAEQEQKPKINTSKAVWVVGAVLLATIIICTIAIFGRQRCQKTPKNRRYV